MLCFVFERHKLLVKNNHGTIVIPTQEELAALGIRLKSEINIGSIATKEHSPCGAAEVAGALPELPGDFALISMRKLFAQSDDDFFRLAGRAYQIINWARKHQFCGQCGAPNINKADEVAMECPGCGALFFPRISPAVIVAVVKEDKILLARNVSFPNGFYSVLAGFVEPGETLEECVLREVREEVGIEVQNIRYFGSQSWPFPDSLMIAFTAEYAAGEIVVDQTELTNADWFSRSAMPMQVPENNAIASRLIQWFLAYNNN
ncbi:MAG: NAD(+) diphosphatase [Firmicutes bacterium]|nr:NAD(+) diphosphatase [Bacillota bacterium]